MKHHASSAFWTSYGQLPAEIQRLADKNFELLKTDPSHPSLQFKKVGKVWSARIGINYRSLAIQVDDGFLWFWIGCHAEYDKLVGR
ncbi:hypothetical protein [Methylomonas koyamae]|uniref:hypothetical protein n=1 Tax=Methylomonas koyamae TaxID=702114 RepID=UPI0009EE326D|nr:hypothetical protein [Methylomonas koyamae]